MSFFDKLKKSFSSGVEDEIPVTAPQQDTHGSVRVDSVSDVQSVSANDFNDSEQPVVDKSSLLSEDVIVKLGGFAHGAGRLAGKAVCIGQRFSAGLKDEMKK